MIQMVIRYLGNKTMTVKMMGRYPLMTHEEFEEDAPSDDSEESLDSSDEEDPDSDVEGWLGPEDGEERLEENVDEELGL